MAAVRTVKKIVFADSTKTDNYHTETSKHKNTPKLEDTSKVSQEDIELIAQHCCVSVKRLIVASSHAEDATIAKDSIKN